MTKKTFDATTRKLIEMGPADWHAYLGSPVPDPGRLKVIDSNLSTVTAESDKVLWVEDPEPWIEHIELQAGRDVDLQDRGHTYSTLLHAHHKVPVRTVMVLLRPAADGPELTGILEKKWHNGEVYDWFRYHVVRVWEQPVDLLLACGPTVLPLAPVSNVEEEKLPEVLVDRSSYPSRFFLCGFAALREVFQSDSGWSETGRSWGNSGKPGSHSVPVPKLRKPGHDMPHEGRLVGESAR